MAAWTVLFAVNGDEYTTSVTIHAKTVKQTGPSAVLVNGRIRVETNETIERIVGPQKEKKS